MLSLLAELAKVTRPKFASFTYRSKETGELARFVVLLGVEYTSLIIDAKAVMEAKLSELVGLPRDAALALIATYTDTIVKGAGNNPRYTHGKEQGDTYVHLAGIDGVKVNKNDGVLHVSGLVISKVVLEAGTYKNVNSAPLTLAKKELERELKKSKWRQFALTNIQSARINGETLELS
jgi:hypothetical protein